MSTVVMELHEFAQMQNDHKHEVIVLHQDVVMLRYQLSAKEDEVAKLSSRVAELERDLRRAKEELESRTIYTEIHPGAGSMSIQRSRVDDTTEVAHVNVKDET